MPFQEKSPPIARDTLLRSAVKLREKHLEEIEKEDI